jgi:hypothetical protein
MRCLRMRCLRMKNRKEYYGKMELMINLTAIKPIFGL